MRPLSLLALASALALVACASEPQWVKDGVSGKQAAADYSDCQSQAQNSTQRDSNIEADIMASRGHDWQQSGTLGAHEAAFAAESQKQSDQIVRECMIGKGYAPHS